MLSGVMLPRSADLTREVPWKASLAWHSGYGRDGCDLKNRNWIDNVGGARHSTA